MLVCQIINIVNSFENRDFEFELLRIGYLPSPKDTRKNIYYYEDEGKAGGASTQSSAGFIPAIFGGVQLQTDPLQAEKPPLPRRIDETQYVLTGTTLMEAVS